MLKDKLSVVLGATLTLGSVFYGVHCNNRYEKVLTNPARCVLTINEELARSIPASNILNPEEVKKYQSFAKEREELLSNPTVTDSIDNAVYYSRGVLGSVLGGLMGLALLVTFTKNLIE